jgi:pyruvate/2-oxoacid:ferredoxin oxidoreductase beta subunit
MSEHVFDKYLRAGISSRPCGAPAAATASSCRPLYARWTRRESDQDKVVVVSGVGCSSRAVNYLDACGLHTNTAAP